MSFFQILAQVLNDFQCPLGTSILFKTHACLLMIRLDGLLDSLAIQDCGYLMLRHYYKEDVRLDHSVPHIIITPNAHRRLKNSANERIVPISGVILWAVEQATRSTSSSFLFPKYMKTGICNANSASAAANKCIKSIVSPNV